MWSSYRPKFALTNLFVYLFAVSVVLRFKLSHVAAQNQCSTDKLFVQINPVNQVIFKFQCTSGNQMNPNIPIGQGSSPVEFNELVLSPNLYTIAPVTQVCQFANLYLLDLSYNQITNTTGLFVELQCLSQLTQLDLSHNLIASPLVSTDFDDAVAARLQSLNLQANRIPSVDSAVFFKADGTARFPALSYLSLANNRLVAIDLLWPMTIPNANLRVELNHNQIDALDNPLQIGFGTNVLIPMTGNRYVDLRNNSLSSLTDSNLLQYGLESADDFRSFLFKISNYDFRGSSFACSCPPNGLYTVYWYSQFVNITLNPSALIYQLTCSNFPGIFIFDFVCQLVASTRIPTTVSPAVTTIQATTQQISTSKIEVTSNGNITTTASTMSTTLGVVVNSAGQLVGGLSSSSSGTITSSSQLASASLLGLLALLVVPFLLILVLLFMCCCGRLCLSCLYNTCGISACTCFRPDSSTTSKQYDAVVCYNEFDQDWVEQKFMPDFANMLIGTENKKPTLTKLTRLGGSLSQAEVDTLRSSKRIVLIVTKKFMGEEWKNKVFREMLAEINRTDLYCNIIVVNLSEVDKSEIRQIANDIELGNSSESWMVKTKNRLANHVKYNCGLRDVEYLDWHEGKFWPKMSYLMPRTAIASHPSVKKAPKYDRVVRGKTDSPEPIINKTDEIGSRRNSNASVDNNSEITLVTKIKRLSEGKRVTPVDRVGNDNDHEHNSNGLTTDIRHNSDEERVFWSSLVHHHSPYTYEPVSIAGSAVSGNREANLNRFGVPIRHEDAALTSTRPPQYARTFQHGRGSSNSSVVKTVTSASSSSASRYAAGRADMASTPTPSTERILIPPEFIPSRYGQEVHPTTQELEIRETSDGMRDVRPKKPAKSKSPKRSSDEKQAPFKQLDSYDDIQRVIEENELNDLPKPRKLIAASLSPLPSRTTAVSKKGEVLPRTVDDEQVVKKPKKKVMISSDIQKYNLSDDDDLTVKQQHEILDELDDYLNGQPPSTASKKKKSSSRKKKKKDLQGQQIDGSKEPNANNLFDFEKD